MDKAKTLEVLRGMKFMQRKEEAKRRATFEVAQREEIERHLHIDESTAAAGGGAGGGADAVRGARRGPARATVLYDDGFPASGYGLSRRTFTDALGGTDTTETPDATLDEVDNANTGLATSSAVAANTHGAYSSDDEEGGEDLWESDEGEGEDDNDGATDPTAAPRRGGASKRDGASHKQQQQQQQRGGGGRGDGRFTVQSAVRAPKLPRRLEEAVTEEERQRKRRRAEDEDAHAFV